MSIDLITLFDSQNPCWTKELFITAGENPSELDELESMGLISLVDNIYALTEKGQEKFRERQKELYLDTSAGDIGVNRPLAAKRTKLRLLLDIAHSQRWGIKEFYCGKSFRVWPKLAKEELFCLDNGLKWLYESSAIYQKMAAEFPYIFIDRRKTDLGPAEKLRSWLAENCPEAGLLTADLLYLSRYDFIHYTDFKGHPNDPDRIINTDRFLFVFAEEEMSENIETVGHFHLWLNTLRRMVIPGYADRDTQEQDSVFWLLFVTEKEQRAAALAKELAAYDPELVKNANPCEVWTISFEALENVTESKEVIWELLPIIAHQTQRAIV